jgi:outer membrane autotransporter protein
MVLVFKGMHASKGSLIITKGDNMNKIHRVVWHAVKQQWCVVSELTKSHKKLKQKIALTAAAMLLATTTPLAHALTTLNGGNANALLVNPGQVLTFTDEYLLTTTGPTTPTTPAEALNLGGGSSVNFQKKLTINTSGAFSGGISTFGIGAKGVFSAVAITTSGESAFGILAKEGSNLTINGQTNIDLLGANTFGILAFGSNVVINAPTYINTTGAGATAYYTNATVDYQSSLLMQEVFLNTKGEGAHGIGAQGTATKKASTTAKKVKTKVEGKGSNSVVSRAGSKITVTESLTAEHTSTSGVAGNNSVVFAQGDTTSGAADISLNTSTISSKDTTAHGIHATGVSTVTTTGLTTITTEGQTSHGVLIDEDAKVGMGDAKITTGRAADNANTTSSTTNKFNGEGSNGVSVQGGTFTSTGTTTVETNGFQADGILVTDGATGKAATVNATDIVATTKGQKSTGVAVKKKSTVKAKTVTASTKGTESHGVTVTDSAKVKVEKKTTTKTTGTKAKGAYVYLTDKKLPPPTVDFAALFAATSGSSGATALEVDGPATVTSTETNLSTTGDNSSGMIVTNGGQVAVSDTLTITATGAGSNGLEVTTISTDTQTTQVTTTSTTSITAANNGVVLTAADAAATAPSLTLNSGSQITAGNVGILTDNASTSVSTVDLTSTSVQAATAYQVTQGDAVLNLKQSSITGTTSAIDVGQTAASTVTVNATSGSILKGNAVAADGSELTLNLTDSALQGTVTNAANVSTTHSQMELTGSSSIKNLSLAASTVSFKETTPIGQSLTVSQMSSTDTSSVALRTSLATDGSGLSDKIIVTDNGQVSGPIVFNIKPSNVGPGSNVLGVEFLSAGSGATVDTTQMSLKNGAISAGAYNYFARQSDLKDNPNNLYLTNFLPKGATIGKNGFIDMTGVTDLNDGTLTIAPSFITYAEIQNMINASGIAILGTYHERMGNENSIHMLGETGLDYQDNSWGRIFQTKLDQSRTDAAYGQVAESRMQGFQLGHIVRQALNDQGNTHQTGGYIAYMKTDSTIKMQDGASSGLGQLYGATDSSIDIDTWALGLTHTTVRQKDAAYIDWVAQYSDYSVDVSNNVNLKTNGYGLKGSVEVGRPYQYDKVNVQPQAQLIAFFDHFDDTKDTQGYPIAWSDSQGLVGRLGVRLEKSAIIDRFQPNLTLNVWKQLSNETSVEEQTSQTSLNGDMSAAWWELSLGATYALRQNMHLYGHVGVSYSLDGGAAQYDAKEASVGLNIQW